jgi:hypothetical protein
MTAAIPKGNTWSLFGEKYPDFWSKGLPHCTFDPDKLFPEGYMSEQREQDATVVCIGCPYIQECLQFALENDEWGVWGGTTRKERKTMRARLGYE